MHYPDRHSYTAAAAYLAFAAVYVLLLAPWLRSLNTPDWVQVVILGGLTFLLQTACCAYKQSVKPTPTPLSEDLTPSASEPPQQALFDKITIKTPNGLKFITFEEILYLKAEGDYVAVVTRNGRWLKEQTMKYFQENLPPESFVRIHRSYIVHIDRISSLERSGDQIRVRLCTDEALRLSESGYKLLKARLGL